MVLAEICFMTGVVRRRAEELLAERHGLAPDAVLMCATHNVDSITYAKQVFLSHNPQLSFAQLMGMSDDVSDELAQVYTTYKYVPFGNLWETVPYLVRRWYEVMVWV